MDTPGFSAIEFNDVSLERLPTLFPEFSNYVDTCKFNPCYHEHEPICGIKDADVYKRQQYGCINVHASILPKYRGAAPIHYAILNGDTKTGVTVSYTHLLKGEENARKTYHCRCICRYCCV